LLYRRHATEADLAIRSLAVIGIMSADGLEDYLELKSPRVTAAIFASRKDHVSGKSRPAATLLAEFKKAPPRKRA
jgi:hypothetical protein